MTNEKYDIIFFTFKTKYVITQSINNEPARKTGDGMGQQIVSMEHITKEFPGVPTYAILPIHRMGEETDPTRELSLQEARRRIGEKCDTIPQVTVIDGEAFVPWDDAMYVDGLHPNDLGHSHYAGNLIAELKKHLS